MTIARRTMIVLLVFAISVCLFACNGRPLSFFNPQLELASYQPPNLIEFQQQVFESVWNNINDDYLRRDFGGTDWDDVKINYSNKLDADLSPDEFNQLLKEMIGEIPNSSIQLLTRQERIDQFVSDSRGVSGIGPFVAIRDGENEERRLIVLHVIPGSPAAEAGLRSHDAVIAIDGEPIGIDEGRGVFKRLRGEAGSKLQLMIRSPQQDPRIITITRRPTPSESIELKSSILPETNILLVEFPPHEDRSILNEFSAVLDQIRAQTEQQEGLIIDMRLMMGIQPTAIFQLLPLFVDGEVAERNNRGELSRIAINGVPSPLQKTSNIPIALIVGPETAGPAELFAAALQDQGRAIVIGQTTAGSLEEFKSHFLQNGAQLTMPITTLSTLKNPRDIGQLGVEPNIFIGTEWDEITSENDPAVNAAIKAILNSLGPSQPPDG